ncbi:MAG: HPr(Ser) kinase/phosphatase [bacterium]|nr:HPr(Ser) kinase/phosphatase [bacterium]
MSEYKVVDLISEIKDFLILKNLTSKKTLENQITTPELIQPGLALAGYFEHFYPNRIQVLSRAEVSYLRTVTTKKLKKILEFHHDYNIPAFILTSCGTSMDKRIIRVFNQYNISLIESTSNLDITVTALSGFLHDKFAESISLHGVLMDVFGVGILISGISGIGKSECALDLIERRHRLVADDLVIGKKISGMLIGGSLNSPLKFHLEVRGVGIIDVKKLFGICSIRNRKRIEVIVELVEPKDALYEDRSGLDRQVKAVLGVDIQLIKLPISSVSNIAKTVEVIAMRYLGEQMTECKMEEFNQRLIEILETKDSILQKKEEGK